MTNTGAGDRASWLVWLQDNAEDVLDFEFLAQLERHPRHATRFRVLRTFDGPATDLGARAKEIVRTEIGEDDDR